MSNTNTPSVLFIVQAGKNFGIGHLKRALHIASYYKNSYFWVITDLKETSSLEKLLENVSHEISFYKEAHLNQGALTKYPYELVITDCDKVSLSFMDLLQKHSLSYISLDNKDLGDFSEIFIAPLPSKKIKNANFHQLYHSPIREEFFQTFQDNNIKNILISIGGSDPRNAAQTIVKSLKDTDYNITLIEGPLSQYSFKEEIPNLKILNNVSDLHPHIMENDLIFCGPGSTLLESLAAQKPVVAVAHTYTQASDLQTIANLKILYAPFLTIKKIRHAIDQVKIIPLTPPQDFTFKSWWLKLSEQVSNRGAYCPLCGSHYKKALLRNEEVNHFKCATCQSIYLYTLKKPLEKINADKLIASNPEQNLSSYKIGVLEQKENSHRRIQIIKKLLPTPGYNTIYKLLDIGANHGIFVQEASHNGYQAQGIELADFARRIAVENNIQIFDSMEKLYETSPIFQVVTVWNKLHLLENPLEYLKRISNLLAIGGVLAIRLPIEKNQPLMKGLFQASLKGGELLAKRIGMHLVQHTKVIDNNQEYFEFYCIKQGTVL